MKLASVRKFALSLGEVTEEPHHNFSSFRCRGKIFVTVPPDEEHVHVFPAESIREQALAMYPEFVEKLLWGGKVVGVRVNLPNAEVAAVKSVIRAAYELKSQSAPASSSERPKRSAAPQVKARGNPGVA
jgi:hypothetical protein